MTLSEIIRKDPKGVVARAYAFSEKAHAGQKRKTDEPYFSHAEAAAEILATWGMDETTIAAGFLHDVAEDTAYDCEEIKKEFGDEVAFLVDGVTKLGRVKYRGAEGKVENLRKIILAISQDLRVVFIKLADRLHNMQTLSALPLAKQKRIALETNEVYAPLAYRLGMREISGELQDLAFPILYPAECAWLQTQVAEAYEARREYLERVRPELETVIKNAGIKILGLDFRAKRPYSLYKKLIRYDMDLDKIYDLVALRLILPGIEDCYGALGAIHGTWPPLPGRIKDYIATPKANHYRSLHTTVIGPEGKYMEIQLRTKEMNEENEFGIAAHWLYKERKATWAKKLTDAMRWIEQLRNWQEKYRGTDTDPHDFLSSMKVEFFKDRIFAITPKGDVIDLPAGATSVDFAYHIHSAVGNTCVGAKVNGHFMPLDHILQSGDMVEVLTQKNKRPSEDWLKFVKTNVARDHIRAAIKTKQSSLQQSRVPTKTELRIVVHDRVGLLKDITAVIARSHVNIIGFHVDHSPGSQYPIDKVVVATADRQKIEKLIFKLKKIKEVREVSFKLI